MTSILVDDEKDSREILAKYLAKYCPEIELLAMCDSVKTGVAAIRKHDPDIVFLDIEMPYGNGFDLLDQVGRIRFETVFVTAFDNYAIQALNQSAAYYLLKPIDIDELINAVRKIGEERSQNGYMQHVNVLVDNIRLAQGAQKVMLPTMEGFEIIPVSDIIHCEADDNFTKFHLKDGKTPLICRTLKHFEATLSPFRFLRIHRSHLVNTDYIIRYTKGKGGFVTMENGSELEVSEKRKAKLMEVFKR